MCLVAILACSHVIAAPILILGDSLSASYGIDEEQGWVYLMRKHIPQHSITNGSVSGETTAGGLRRLPALLDSIQPELVIIELGGNDGLRGFPPQQLKENLTKIITLVKAQGSKILLSDILLPPNYGPRYAQMFNKVYQDLATEHQITLMPFFMTTIATKPELMQRDGIHPNKLAQQDIVNFILPWINDML
ncbi:arylesterase [Shewanella sp. VB17]|uniref:arylesterase n=1 Tax=Shewanella sp. VB17 TaxID=2739432 RepID=UPI001566E353|nr:arylesterase [Shewanella sp. VB17]NRD73637.1 arylesterase [Shewanella sp. VB17]